MRDDIGADVVPRSDAEPTSQRGRTGRAPSWAAARASRSARWSAWCWPPSSAHRWPWPGRWSTPRCSEKVGTSPTTFTLSTRGSSEVRLGIAGTVYVPQSLGPIGVVATVEGPGDPGAGDGDLANYVRPEMLKLYTGLFHDPGAAVDEYVVPGRARPAQQGGAQRAGHGGGRWRPAARLLLPRAVVGAHPPSASAGRARPWVSHCSRRPPWPSCSSRPIPAVVVRARAPTP